MVDYLLDTNTCVYALKDKGAVREHLQERSPETLFVSTVTLAELWFGARKSARPEKNRAVVDAFLGPFSPLPFDRAAAEAYAGIRFELERAGAPIEERDLLIASIARSRRLAVVTHNRDEFERVPGLKVEDWS